MRWVVAVMLVFSYGCSHRTELEKSAPSIETSRSLLQKGRQFFAMQEFDSAEIFLGRSLALDPTNTDALVEIGGVHHGIGRASTGARAVMRQHYLKSLVYLARAESLGVSSSEVLERLCEIAVELEDRGAFLRYAKKNATLFPYDRQAFNLGLAHFENDEFREAIEVLKTAVERFTQSPFIGSMYRVMGRAYMKLQRNQTAERTFIVGIQAVEDRLRSLGGRPPEEKNRDDVRRLREDRVGMLMSLKGLHQIYQDHEKLRAVEQKLREANSPAQEDGRH